MRPGRWPCAADDCSGEVMVEVGGGDGGGDGSTVIAETNMFDSINPRSWSKRRWEHLPMS